MFAPRIRLPLIALRSPVRASVRQLSQKLPSKDEVKPQSKESTQSGTNDEIAADASAYDPNTTNPVKEKSEIGDEVREHTPQYGVENPLEMSGATPEVSQEPNEERVTKGEHRKPSGGSKRA